MTVDQCDACLAHLAAAEVIMEATNDLAGLARLALVIDCFREQHGLPARTAEDLMLEFDPRKSVA